jgi:hypothetical protein
MAVAVTQFAREGNQSAIDGESARGSERLGFFVHELRNLISTALMAFDIVLSGASACRGVPARCGAEANHGSIYARDLAGVGCVFTVDLPRLAVTAFASTS